MGNGLPFLGQDVQTLHEETLTQPLRWSKPRGIFVCSMTDLFWDPKEAGGGQGTTDDQLDAIFDVMERAHWHTYQILTKRAERMADVSVRTLPARGARASVGGRYMRESDVGGTSTGGARARPRRRALGQL
jgi:protein gp37